ncbi:hypothetical protein H8959_014969 [Pygathrix nigripes]
MPGDGGPRAGSDAGEGGCMPTRSPLLRAPQQRSRWTQGRQRAPLRPPRTGPPASEAAGQSSVRGGDNRAARPGLRAPGAADRSWGFSGPLRWAAVRSRSSPGRAWRAAKPQKGRATEVFSESYLKECTCQERSVGTSGFIVSAWKRKPWQQQGHREDMELHPASSVDAGGRSP